MNLRAVVLVAACTVAFAPSVSARTAADADQVRVTFTNGRVTLIADNATVSEILREWARVGGSQFVNGDKIPSMERLTLRLENETEIRALEVLLRSVAGYFIAPRTASMPGPSSVGRVVIMPVSQIASFAQAAPPPQGAASQNEMTAPQRQITAAPPRPDDDGPTRQMVPPPGAPAIMGSASQTAPGAPAATPQSPAATGHASPLGGAQTQTVPGLGPTSRQPGAVMPVQRQGGGRPVITPTQPRPGGGGG